MLFIEMQPLTTVLNFKWVVSPCTAKIHECLVWLLPVHRKNGKDNHNVNIPQKKFLSYWNINCLANNLLQKILIIIIFHFIHEKKQYHQSAMCNYVFVKREVTVYVLKAHNGTFIKCLKP